MKKLKSLALSFSLAAGSLLGLGASAQAQTVPVTPQGNYYSQQSNYATVSQSAIDDIAYNVGVREVYYRTGVGYTEWVADTGENVGLKFVVNGRNATVTAAYNLDIPQEAQRYYLEKNNTISTENRLAMDETRYGWRNYNYYQPQEYIICAPVNPILAFGLIISGWHVGYMPHYHSWDGYWDGGRRNTVIIERHETIIRENHNNNRNWNQPRYDVPRHEEHPRVVQPRDDHRRFEQPRVEQPRIQPPHNVDRGDRGGNRGWQQPQQQRGGQRGGNQGPGGHHH